MTPIQRRNAYAFGAVCTVITVGLLAWPVRPAQDPAPAPAPGSHYAGPEYTVRRTSPATGPGPLRLTSSQPVTAAPATPVVAAPTLVGLVGNRQAYLRSATSGEIERVAVGSEIDGWRVTAMSGRTVTVNGPGGQQRLQLFDPTPTTSSENSASAQPESAG